MRKLGKILKWTLLVLVLLLLALWILIQTSFFQNWVIDIATNKLSKELKTKVSIKQVDFSLFNKFLMEGTLIEDRQQDTVLYAGALKVNITDWFFLKDKIELSYIGLDDAVIKLQRSDSVWRYKFIADYFSGGQKNQQSSNLQLSLDKVELNRVKVMTNDGWRGKNETIAFSKLKVDANHLNFNNTKYEISEIKLVDPLYASFDYTGNRPDSLIPKTIPPVKGILEWNADSLEVMVKKLVIENGTVKVDRDDNRKAYDYFDGHHILFSNINGELNNIRLYRDTIFAKLNLATKERSGFTVNKIAADFRLHPHAMIFDNLDLVTPRSHLRKYYSMSFDNFNDDMNSYISNVIMEGHFEDSEIDSDDITYFAPELSEWKKKISITGNVKGTVENIAAKNIVLEAGKNTTLKGDISINGLPDIDKTFIDFKANDFRSNYADLSLIFPQIRSISNPNLASVNYLHFTGSLTGFVRDFVTAGIIETNLGTIRSDLNLKLPANKPALYSGKLSTTNFNLGVFLDDKSLSTLSIDASLKGAGFSSKNVNAAIKAEIRDFGYNGYTYHNVSANGTLRKLMFDGHIDSKDENAGFTLDGQINFDKKKPAFNFTSFLDKVNLKPLGFAKENVSLSGNLNGNFSGLSLDKFLGTANASDFTISRDDKSFHFDAVQLTSSYIDSTRILQLDSKDATASIRGKFDISNLANDIQYFLNHYYPAYIALPKSKPTRNNFSFSLRTRTVDDLVQVIDPNLSGLNNTQIDGTVDLLNNKLLLSGDIPYFKYRDVEFFKTSIRASGNRDTLGLLTTTENLTYQDSISFPKVGLYAKASRDTTNFRLLTIDNPTFKSLDINATLYTFNDGFRLKFLPSYFDVFDKKWILEKDGEVELRDNLASASGIKFIQGDKYIEINTQPSATDKHNDVVVNFRKVNIGDFLPLIVKEPKMEGVSTGTIYITDPFHHPRIETGDIVTENFILNNDSIGKIVTEATYDFEKGLITYKGKSDDPNHKFNINGSYNLKDSTDKQLYTEISVDNTSIAAVATYLGSIMSNVKGTATGTLKMYGRGNNPKYNGTIHLSNASFIVDYTKCKYYIKDADLKFVDDGIDFGTVMLTDSLSKSHTGTLTGKLYHTNFGKMSFDFTLNTGKLLLLNTTEKDNNQFYGKAIGRARVRLTGPQNDMRMTLSGEATDSSSIFIPVTDSRESGLGKDIIFKQYGKEMKTGFGSEETNITVDLDLTTNNLTQLSVILDPATDDIIQARGTGNLRIRAGNIEPLSIRGRYNISTGKYTYNLQNLIEKPFILSANSGSFIEWNGDPYEANLFVRAKYTAEKVRFSDLLGSSSNISINSNEIKSYQGNVDIYALIKGRLSQPDIKFEISFPPNTPIGNDPVVNSLLAQLRSDENEMSKQVSTLLVFNQFTPLQQGLEITNTLNTGLNSISSIVVSQINSLLNKALAKATGWDINISNSFYNVFANNANNMPDRSKLNLRVVRNFFNNRFSITFESDFDIRVSQAAAASSSSSLSSRDFVFLPNITAEYKITNDGKLSLTLFYRDNIDFLNPQRRNRAGIGLSYRAESDSYTRLRKKKMKEQQQKTAETNSAANPAGGN